MSALRELVIHVRYRDGGAKAARFFATNSPESVTQLLQDLELLKFPTPKKSNVQFESAGCVKASWTCYLNGPLHRRLKALAYRTKSPSFTQFWGSMTPADLEITWITLEENPVEDPSILPDADTYTPVHANRGGKKMRSTPTTGGVPTRNDDTTVTKSAADFSFVGSTESTTVLDQSRNRESSLGHMNDEYLPPAIRRRSSRDCTNKVQQIEKVMQDLHQRLTPKGDVQSPPQELDLLYGPELAYERAARGKLEIACNRARRALDTARAKLADVDGKLKREQEKCAYLEAELARERKNRKEAEDVLKDVERECRAPFVVPAMLEAFSMISKITNWAMDMDNQSVDGNHN